MRNEKNLLGINFRKGIASGLAALVVGTMSSAGYTDDRMGRKEHESAPVVETVSSSGYVDDEVSITEIIGVNREDYPELSQNFLKILHEHYNVSKDVEEQALKIENIKEYSRLMDIALDGSGSEKSDHAIFALVSERIILNRGVLSLITLGNYHYVTAQIAEHWYNPENGNFISNGVFELDDSTSVYIDRVFDRGIMGGKVREALILTEQKKMDPKTIRVRNFRDGDCDGLKYNRNILTSLGRDSIEEEIYSREDGSVEYSLAETNIQMCSWPGGNNSDEGDIGSLDNSLNDEYFTLIKKVIPILERSTASMRQNLHGLEAYFEKEEERLGQIYLKVVKKYPEAHARINQRELERVRIKYNNPNMVDGVLARKPLPWSYHQEYFGHDHSLKKDYSPLTPGKYKK